MSAAWHLINLPSRVLQSFLTKRKVRVTHCWSENPWPVGLKPQTSKNCIPAAAQGGLCNLQSSSIQSLFSSFLSSLLILRETTWKSS